MDGNLVTPSILHTFLLQYGCSKQRADYLFDSRDVQDLYRALDLIETIDAYVKTGSPPRNPLSTIRYRREHDLPPAQSRTRPIPGTDRNIALVNDLITSFAWPFITITMGLNERIETLSEYSHLTLALFGTSKEGEIKGVKFMPWALYWDTQMTVRDVFIGVAKAQEVDPEGYFFLTSMGKDA